MPLPYGAEALIGGTINIGNFENVRFELRASVRDQAELDALKEAFRLNVGTLGREEPQVCAAVDSFIRRVLGTGAQQGPGGAIAPAVDPTPGPAPTKATAKPEPARTPLSTGVDPATGRTPLAIQGPLGSPCARTDCDRYIGCNRVGETCPLLGKDTTPAPDQVGRAAPEEPDPNAGLGKFAKHAAPQTTTKDPHVPSSSPAPAAAPPTAAAKPAPKSPEPGKVCSICGAAMSTAEVKTSMLFVSKLLCKPCLETGGKESQAATDEQLEALKAEAQRHRDAQDAHAARAAEASRA